MTAVPAGRPCLRHEPQCVSTAAADFDAMADLWVASWQEAMPAIDFSARRPWIVARLQDWPAAETFTAVADGRPTGFLLLDEAAGLIDQLVVTPAAKGDGTAKLLLQAARLRASAGLGLDVNADNARAIRFYEREGFRKEAPGINPASGLPTWHMRAPPLIQPPSAP